MRWDPNCSTTVFVEQVTSNEPWGPTTKDCAKVADLSFDWTEAQKAMEVRGAVLRLPARDARARNI